MSSRRCRRRAQVGDVPCTACPASVGRTDPPAEPCASPRMTTHHSALCRPTHPHKYMQSIVNHIPRISIELPCYLCLLLHVLEPLPLVLRYCRAVSGLKGIQLIKILRGHKSLCKLGDQPHSEELKRIRPDE